MSWCKICDRFMLYPKTHKCPPVFEVCGYPEDEDYWVKNICR